MKGHFVEADPDYEQDRWSPERRRRHEEDKAEREKRLTLYAQAIEEMRPIPYGAVD